LKTFFLPFAAGAAAPPAAGVAAFSFAIDKRSLFVRG
jgi:hypothetical protein